MQYFGFDRPSFGIKTYGFGSSEFSPLELFAGGKQGVWYDPSDKSTLFQDVAGTVPVTKDGDPVALMKDKSGNGNHATQSVSTARPVYKTDGILHWLTFDGVDDYIASNDFGLAQPVSMALAMSLSSVAIKCLIDGLVINSGSIVANNRALRILGGAAGDTNYYPPLITLNKNHIYDARLSGSTTYVTFDNNPITTRHAGTATMGGITVGALAGGIGNATLAGRSYGTLVVADNISTDVRQSVKQYLAKKAGVTL